MRLKITGGSVFDPASGWEGEVRDLYVDGDRLVTRSSKMGRVLEVKNHAVFAAGLDLRGQAATYGLDFLSLWDGFLPPGELGLAYARLGYTQSDFTRSSEHDEKKIPITPSNNVILYKCFL